MVGSLRALGRCRGFESCTVVFLDVVFSHDAQRYRRTDRQTTRNVPIADHTDAQYDRLTQLRFCIPTCIILYLICGLQNTVKLLKSLTLAGVLINLLICFILLFLLLTIVCFLLLHFLAYYCLYFTTVIVAVVGGSS